MSNGSSGNKSKPPSELSLELFAARVEADETIPEPIRSAIRTNKDKGLGPLLSKIKSVIGEGSEN